MNRKQKNNDNCVDIHIFIVPDVNTHIFIQCGNVIIYICTVDTVEE